jgi:ComF family protein
MAPPPFVRAVAYGLYEEPMRGALHAFKYGGLHALAGPLGEMLAQAIAKLAVDAPAELLVVPVPLHRSKLAARGFNQARLLSFHALRFLSKSHPTWRLTLASTTLMRLRETESQAGLTPRERRINLRGAFSVSTPGAVTAKHILLVDDILTTGATARAASQALLKAGAASVWVATLARARRSNPFARDFLFDSDQDDSASDLIHDSTTLPGSYASSSHHQPSFFARG